MIVSLKSGSSFGIAPGETILQAAESNRIQLAYSCKIGRCNACKSKVIQGESQALYEELGLTASEKAEGWILSCVRMALTDMSLDVEDLGCFILPQVKTLPCRISRIDKLTSDVVCVALRLPPTAEFSFIPGQYIELIGPGGVRRSYSLANAKFLNKQLELHIRAVEGGELSQYWFGQAKVNDLLRLNGPLGTFFLRDVSGLDLVFMATGTGMSPVKAMLESMQDLAYSQQPRSVTVLWGGRTQQDFYFDAEGILSCFNFVPVLSRADLQWTGARGYVQQVLLSVLPNLGQAAVYACGSAAMIRDARIQLTAAGLPNNRFYSDSFVCTAVI